MCGDEKVAAVYRIKLKNPATAEQLKLLGDVGIDLKGKESNLVFVDYIYHGDADVLREQVWVESVEFERDKL